MNEKIKIAVVLGSESDKEPLEEAFKLLADFAIPFSLDIISAHRHPERLREFSQTLEQRGVQVVIACAGMAAALPGFIASYADIPVIGVAMKGGILDGVDALFSMVSIPKGIGLCSTGIGKSAFINAVILALEIIALNDKAYGSKLKALKSKFNA